MKRIAWTDPAIDDLTSLRAYIEKDNPAAAREIALNIIKMAEKLADHPNRGRPGRVQNTRELVIPNTPFIIPYRIRGDSIEILRVLHGAMKWPEGLD